MFCKEQVAQLRDALPEIIQRGAELKIIGSGRPDQANEFLRDVPIDAPVYSDPNMKAYRAAGLRRDMRSNANLKTLKHGIRAVRKGFMQTKVKGDPWQQGGVFVITPDGRPLFQYVSSEAGDHPDPKKILEALKPA